MNKLSINPVKTELSFYSTNAENNKNVDKSVNKVYLAGACAVGLVGVAFLGYRNYNNMYKVRLAKDLTKELGRNITTNDLKSVMSKSELFNVLPKLTEQNYVASESNIKNGTFLADLHSHSNFSDGKASVETILNQAADYGNKLSKINGKKFIFALSDHDGVDGVKEALKIIVENPQKYENIRFVPAAEISFIMPTQKNSPRFTRFQSDVQMPEMLVYCVNPFSNKSNEFFNSIYDSRTKQIEFAIRHVNSYLNSENLSTGEYKKFFTEKGRKPCLLNQHWNIWNYIHTKQRVSEIAREQNVGHEELFEKIVHELKKENKSINPYELNEYIKRKNIITSTTQFNSNISNILKKQVFPIRVGEYEAVSNFEKQFKDIVKYSIDENAVLGFAHPVFTMQNFDKQNCLEGMATLVKQGKGKIKFAEKYHQAYPIGKEIESYEIKEYNEILDKLGLINIGGRDNHSDKFIPF
jgi:hypothetical protein